MGTGVGGTSTAGPHSSDMMNKADPRVDSDMDGSRGLGGTGSGIGGTSSGMGTTGSSLGSDGKYVEGSEKHHRGDGHPEDIVHPGPHMTSTAKKLDPHMN
ncbi:MAG: hypothetical protein Q9164_003720 [Protoblastenia rupestris]